MSFCTFTERMLDGSEGPENGASGRLDIQFADESPVFPAFVQAAAKVNVPCLENYNGEKQLGFGRTACNTTKDWTRSGAFQGALAPVLGARSNLKVIHEASAIRVDFDSDRAVGVTYINEGKPVSVRELSLGVSRDNVEIRGEVAQLDLAEDRVLIRNLRLHGATGELNGDAELTPQTLSVTAQGQNLDLSAFSRVLGLPRGVLEGRASVTVDALTSGKTQRGSLELSVSKATISGVSDISGQLSAKLDGRQLTGASTGRIEALGGFSADWATELDGPPTERASFEHATGRDVNCLGYAGGGDDGQDFRCRGR